jgi:hypothetical protein
MEEIVKHFEIKRNQEINDIIGCKIRIEGVTFLSQTNLIEKISRRFNQRIRNLKEFKTSTRSRVKFMKPKEKETKLTRSYQEEYRSGFALLLYHFKDWNTRFRSVCCKGIWMIVFVFFSTYYTDD